MFSLYLAGSWNERDEMQGYIQKFKELGYNITHDWTKAEDDHIDTRSLEKKQEGAENDISGVKKANAVVVIMDNPKYAYRGTCCEIGCALGLNIPIYLYNPIKSGSYATTNIFYWHKGVKHYDNIDVLIEELNNDKKKKENETEISATEAKKNSEKSIIKSNNNTYKLIISLINRSSNKGFRELNFIFKNKNQDVSYIIEKLIKLDYNIAYDKTNNNIKISWK